MPHPAAIGQGCNTFIIVATIRADHVVVPELYAVLAAVEADVMETIVPYSFVRR